jgi:chemotaxis protein MotB
MISWADMTTLLWACFVLLWSFSTLDLAKFQAAMSSLQGALGVLQGGAMVLNAGQIPQTKSAAKRPADKKDMENIRQRVKKKADEAGYKDSVQVSLTDHGLMIRFADTALFDPGSIDIKDQALPVLDSIAQELSQIANPVRVEGHTDPTPISTSLFPSNWELSTGRATAIVHYFIEQGGLTPDRLSAAGYAFYHPVAPNNTPENRGRNRRVDVIVLNSGDNSPPLSPSREDALSYLESPESTGIVMPPVDEVGGKLRENTKGQSE